MVAMSVFLFIASLFILLGIIFSLGKGSFLIAGYNTLPQKEKAKYDEDALTKFMGKMMFIYAFCVFLWFLGELYNEQAFFIVGLILFIGVTIGMIIYANTGNRFKKNN